MEECFFVQKLSKFIFFEYFCRQKVTDTKMKRIFFVCMCVVTALLFSSCGVSRTVPITGRKQNLLVDDAQILSLSNQQYQEYMKTAKASSDAANTQMVRRVGQRLATAVETYLANNGMAEEVKTFSWEFNLVNDKSVNAFCMPGGKIVVYEGLLPVTKDEASLAIVLGHEIAHAVAKHSAESMSSQIRQQYGLQIAGGIANMAGVSSGIQQLGTMAASAGLRLYSSGFSRKQESEADHLGLIFAAMAGYDPGVAVAFWQRMSAATGGGSSSLLSDHPSDASRIKNIQAWLPEAMNYYKAIGQSVSSSAPAVRQQTRPTSTMPTIHISSKKK